MVNDPLQVNPKLRCVRDINCCQSYDIMSPLFILAAITMLIVFIVFKNRVISSNDVADFACHKDLVSCWSLSH